MRDAIIGVAVFVLFVGAALAFRASLPPPPDVNAALHDRTAQDRRHGEALALQSLCRSYRAAMTGGETMHMGGCGR